MGEVLYWIGRQKKITITTGLRYDAWHGHIEARWATRRVQ